MRIVVGGESRKAGKTTAVCRIIAAFPEAAWTAVKISAHLHGAAAEWSLAEDAAGGDTRRFLEAGAKRALLYCGRVEPGLPALLDMLPEAGNWIVETTTAAHLLPHDLAILVTAPEGTQPKAGAAPFPADVRISASDPCLTGLVAERWKT
jgi:hypothetical protein